VVHEKYTRKNGKVYGPYLYENKRVNGKVVTKYLGKGKNFGVVGEKPSVTDVKPISALGKRKVNPFVFVGLGLVLVLLLFFGLFYSPLTGTVSFDVQSDYQAGENLDGTLVFNLKKGELLPKDSIIVVSLGDQSKEFILSDLVSSDSATGEFFVEDSGLSGSGEGYGVAGTGISYPEIEFDLRIVPRVSRTISGGDSGGGNEDIVEPEKVVEEVVEGVEEVVNGSVEEEVVVEEPPIENIEEVIEEEPENVEGFGVRSITGDVVSEEVLRGVVRSGLDFTYELGEGATAELVPGSVSVGGEAVEDSVVRFDVSGNTLSVSTSYSVEGSGFGEEYLGDVALSLFVDISEFNVSADSGTLRIEVLYNGTELVSYEEEIVVDGVPTEEELPVEEEGAGGVVSPIINETNVTVSEPVNETNVTVDVVVSGNVSVNVITSRSAIRVGEKVRWTKEVELGEEGNVSVKLPGEAENIVVKKKIKWSGVRQTSGDGEVEAKARIIRRSITGQLTLDVDLKKEPSTE